MAKSSRRNSPKPTVGDSSSDFIQGYVATPTEQLLESMTETLTLLNAEIRAMKHILSHNIIGGRTSLNGVDQYCEKILADSKQLRSLQDTLTALWNSSDQVRRYIEKASEAAA